MQTDIFNPTSNNLFRLYHSNNFLHRHIFPLNYNTSTHLNAYVFCNLQRYRSMNMRICHIQNIQSHRYRSDNLRKKNQIGSNRIKSTELINKSFWFLLTQITVTNFCRIQTWFTCTGRFITWVQTIDNIIAPFISCNASVCANTGDLAFIAYVEQTGEIEWTWTNARCVNHIRIWSRKCFEIMKIKWNTSIQRSIATRTCWNTFRIRHITAWQWHLCILIRCICTEQLWLWRLLRLLRWLGSCLQKLWLIHYGHKTWKPNKFHSGEFFFNRGSDKVQEKKIWGKTNYPWPLDAVIPNGIPPLGTYMNPIKCIANRLNRWLGECCDELQMISEVWIVPTSLWSSVRCEWCGILWLWNVYALHEWHLLHIWCIIKTNWTRAKHLVWGNLVNCVSLDMWKSNNFFPL